MSASARYAVYLAPREPAACWRFGCAMIGYDARTGAEFPATPPPGFSGEEWAAFAAEPRRYGFHATIKAPFRLAPGTNEEGLAAALWRFAAGRRRFELSLRPSLLGGFIALTPSALSAAAIALEAAAVDAFEEFRAPLTETEMARRLAVALTPRQKALLDRYGYPYVKEEFRLHFTLSGSLPPDRRSGALAAIEAAYAREVGDEAIVVDDLALFRQDAAEERFRIIASAPFG
jgi:hypothetical protein